MICPPESLLRETPVASSGVSDVVLASAVQDFLVNGDGIIRDRLELFDLLQVLKSFHWRRAISTFDIGSVVGGDSCLSIE